MSDELSRRGFLRNVTAASLAAFFAGKMAGDELSAKTSTGPSFDFRRIRWGMSQDEVIASEDEKVFFRMPAFVMYKLSLDELPFTLTYQFAPRGDDAECVAAVLQTDLKENMFYIQSGITEPPKSLVQDAVRDYQRIKQVLTSEFGRPAVDDLPYRDDDMVEALRAERKNQSVDEKAKAIPELVTHLEQLRELSHDDATLQSLMRYTRWSADRTQITLGLMPTVFGGSMVMVRHDSIQWLSTL